MAIGAVALFSIAGATGDASAVVAFTAQQWFAIAVTGTLLTGYVLTWFGALQRAPATSVTSILVVGAVVTTVLQSWSTGGLPAPTAAFGNVLLLAGGAVAVAAAWLAGGFRASSPATVPTAGA
jgi:uncharacterized membrane protein